MSGVASFFARILLRWWKGLALSLVALSLQVLPFIAQTPAPDGFPEGGAFSTLSADHIEKRADGWIIASGNVVFSDGQNNYRAKTLLFNPQTGDVRLEGAISGFDMKGEAILRSEAMAFNTETQAYSAQNINIRPGDNLQIAAREIKHQGQRYIKYEDVNASACTLCETRQPLWEIRAKTAIFDTKEQKIFFRNAQFLIRGARILTLPHLRLPAPDAKRQEGFLAPNFFRTTRTSDIFMLPYYLPLGEDKDIKITSYLPLSPAKNNGALDLRYRKALRNGNVNLLWRSAKLTGAPVANWAEINGKFSLPQDFNLAFQAQQIDDTTAFDDFLISNTTKQIRTLELTRFRPQSQMTAALTHTKPLQSLSKETSKINGTLAYLNRFYLGQSGKIDAHIALDSYHSPLKTLEAGRDILRLSNEIAWSNLFQFQNGIILLPQITAELQNYRIWQSQKYPSYINRLSYAVGLEARYPLVKNTAQAQNILEPIVKISTTRTDKRDVPNSDSQLFTIDEGNLFSLAPIAGSDVKAHGNHLNLGLRWSRFGKGGLTSVATVGVIASRTASPQFVHLSALPKNRLDHLVALQLGHPSGLSLSSRALLRDKNLPSRYEIRLSYQMDDKLAVQAGYLDIDARSLPNSTEDIEFFTFKSDYKLQNGFALGSVLEYDKRRNRFSKVGLKFGYMANCIDAALRVERKYTAANSVRATNIYKFEISLIGAGRLNETQRRRYCNG